MKAKRRKGMIVITIPVIDPPRPSRSGKRLLVASSRSFRRTALKIENKSVFVNVIATIATDEQQDKKKKPENSKSKSLHKRPRNH